MRYGVDGDLLSESEYEKHFPRRFPAPRTSVS